MEIFTDIKTKPKHKVKIIASTYEEVGYGCANIPEDIDELVGLTWLYRTRPCSEI